MNDKIKITETELQQYLNEHLDAEGFSYFRIPSWFWDWLLKNAPPELLDEIRRLWGGLPDSIIFVPVKVGGFDFTMCLMLELKSKDGTMHGKQKRWHKRLPVYIGRTKPEVVQIMSEFLSIVDVVFQLLEGYNDGDRFRLLNENEIVKKTDEILIVDSAFQTTWGAPLNSQVGYAAKYCKAVRRKF